MLVPSLVTRDCGIVSHFSARFLLLLSQGGCVGHSSLYRWSEPHTSVWASIITKIVKIWDCHSLQNLIPICYSIVIASNSDKFANGGDAAPHPGTAHQMLLPDECNISKSFSLYSVQSACVENQMLISWSPTNTVQHLQMNILFFYGREIWHIIRWTSPT